MWTLLIICVVVCFIFGLIAGAVEEPSAAVVGPIVCFFIAAFWGELTGGIYLDIPQIKRGTEVIYGESFGKVDSIFYLVNDSLIELKHIEIR